MIGGYHPVRHSLFLTKRLSSTPWVFDWMPRVPFFQEGHAHRIQNPSSWKIINEGKKHFSIKFFQAGSIWGGLIGINGKWFWTEFLPKISQRTSQQQMWHFIFHLFFLVQMVWILLFLAHQHQRGSSASTPITRMLGVGPHKKWMENTEMISPSCVQKEPALSTEPKSCASGQF